MAQIHWTSAISAGFNFGTFWSTGTVPGPADDAIIDAVGFAAPVNYTVTSSVNETVLSIQTNTFATLDITAGVFDATAGTNGGVNAGSILVENNAVFEIGGVFNNSGSISLLATNNATTLTVLAGGASLTGAGSVVLGDDANNEILGAAAGATLTNVDNVISGAGQIGGGQLTLVNDALGTINADATNNLIINTGGALDVNSGLMEATYGVLILQNNTIDQSGGGTILAAYYYAVGLQGTEVIGGTLQSSTTAAIQTQAGVNLLDGLTSTVTNQAQVQILNNTVLEIEGAIDNTTTIDLLAGNNSTQLIVSAGAVVSGAGQITLNDNTNNLITASAAGVSLTNVDNVISGAGQLGGGQLLFINDAAGTVNATGANALIVDFGAQTATNDGVFEATGTGGLTIRNSTIDDSGGGEIFAAAGAAVGLQTADILGGLVDGVGGGVVETLDAGSQLDGTAGHAVTALGNLTVLNNTQLAVIGTIDLSKNLNGVTFKGTISVNAGNNATNLFIGQANATVIGGAVALDDDSANQILGFLTIGQLGPVAVSTLTNRTFISGAGRIGVNLRLINDTTVEADGANPLILATGAAGVAGSNTITNAGLLEAANPLALAATGGLVLNGDVIANTLGKGIVEATGATTHVDLESTTIEGGTLETLGGGVIQTVDSGSILDGTAASVANEGEVDIQNNTELTLAGAIDNLGQIDLSAGNNGTVLKITAAGVSLTGAGQVTLDNDSNNLLYGATAAATLTNVDNIISGAGRLGSGQLTLINDKAGVIDADDTTPLLLNTGNATLANFGLIEATGSGGLQINNTTIDDSKGGSLLAATGSAVSLASATIIGGLLRTTGTGVFQTLDSATLLDATKSTVTLKGRINILNNTGLNIAGAIDNTGTISLLAGNNGTELVVDGATLTGGGQILLSDDSNNVIFGSANTATLVNVDNTISGAGRLGAGQLTLINEAAGLINADGTSALVLDISPTIANSGLIEATGAGGLLIESTPINDVTGGVIYADNSLISLQSATIIGGVLKDAGTGAFQTLDAATLLDGTTQAVDSTGQINILNNTGLQLAGAIVNTGAIAIDAGNNGTDLFFVGKVSLTGAGQILMTDDANNLLDFTSPTSMLVNVDNTISGGGRIVVPLDNQRKGVIDATGASALTIVEVGGTVANAGLIEATGAGGLTIQDSTINNSATGLLTVAKGSVINLITADIIGGTLRSVASGFFQTLDSGSLLDGTKAAVKNLATIDIVNNTQLLLGGAIDNVDSINLQAGNNGTNLVIEASVSLTGGGQITMTDDVNNLIVGASATSILTNVDNVISGAGRIGGAALTLINDVGGIIDATGSSALTIDASGTVINKGIIEATGTGGLTLNAVINGGTTGKILIATNSVATLAGATIEGGILDRTGTGRFVTNGASAVLDGTATAITTDAEFDILNNTSLDLAGTIANSGTIEVQAGNNGTALIIDSALVSLTGTGQVILSDDANNIVQGATGTDTLVNVSNTISGAGRLGNTALTLINDKAGIIDGDGANALDINCNATTITNAGLIEATGSGGVVISSAVANSGLLEVDGGNLTAQAAVSGTGAAVIHSGVITFDSTFTGAARFTGASGTLVLAQSQTYAGKVSGFSTHGTAGADFIDLEDVAFTGAGDDHFKGTSASGILTVTDGTHTAKINLTGNYTHSGFVTSSDGHGGTLVTLGKRLPVAVTDTYTTKVSQGLTVTAANGVLANDIDTDGLTLTAVLSPGGGPTHGTLVLSTNGAFIYTPTRGFSGVDSFTYIARDADGKAAPTKVTLAVGNGGPPITQPDAYGDSAGQALTVTAANGVLANDRDLNGLPLTATLAPGGGPAHGALKLNIDGSFTYTPTLGFAGTDTFQYIAGDAQSASAPTTVTITVTAGTPTAKADAYGDAAGHALTITAAKGVLANDTDPNGLALTATLAPGGGPAHGTLTLNADGSFNYTAAAGFAGKDSFTYIASDGLASSGPTTVTVTVTASAPTGKADAYGDAAGHALTETAAAGVLANDTDPNGLPLTAALAPGGGPAHGTLVLNANGSFTYTPTVGFAGKDTFTYIASDSLASSAPTTVTLTITAAPPTSTADSYTDRAGHALTVTAASGVLANDTDPNGLPLTAALAPGLGPQHGTLTLNKDGSFTYTPNAGFAGTDSFDYIASDALESGQPTLVTLTVTAVPPVTRPDTYDAIANQTLTVDAAHGVLANDTDPNGLPLTATLAPGGAPEYGTVKLNADGSFTYILNSGFGGFNGVDSFTYIASDGAAQSAPTTVTIDVSNGQAKVAPSPVTVLTQYAAGLGDKGAATASAPTQTAAILLRSLIAPASHQALS